MQALPTTVSSETCVAAAAGVILMRLFTLVCCFLLLFVLTSCSSQKDDVGAAFGEARDLHEKSNAVQEDLAGKAVDVLLDKTIDDDLKNEEK